LFGFLLFGRQEPVAPAGHEMHHLEKALDAFVEVGKKYNILGKSKQEIIEMYGM